MTYAILGFGAVGQALARSFLRAGLEVAVATTRSPQAFEATARSIGAGIVPKTMQEALNADVILLAVPFRSHVDIGKAASNWQGKIIIDVTNAYGVPLADLDNLPSSAVVSKAFPGATLVKAFNHLPAKALAQDPVSAGGRRVIFLSSDDEDATGTVTNLVKQLGYAPINLGKIAEGGQLIQARDTTWTQLIFQDLFKKDS